MKLLAERCLAFCQLARVGLAYTAVADIWLIALLSEGLGLTAGRPRPALWALMLCTALIGGGLYVFGMTLNDLLDARRDRTFAPDRPIPSGRVAIPSAVAVLLTALLVAAAASVPLGRLSTLVCLLTAAAILFYDGVAKHLPGLGVLTLGLVRALNMLIAFPGLGYVWPVWLTLTHVIGISAAGHRLEGKRPYFAPRDAWIVTSGWAFVTVVMLAWMSRRGHLILPDRPLIWIGPVVAVLAFLVLALRGVRAALNERAAGGGLIKLGLTWLIVYDAAWLLSAGLWWQGAAVALLLPAAWLTMAAVRQLKLAVAAPTGFQRDP